MILLLWYCFYDKDLIAWSFVCDDFYDSIVEEENEVCGDEYEYE